MNEKRNDRWSAKKSDQNCQTKDSLLIIDDDQQALIEYENLFASDFVCFKASNGREGLALFYKIQPPMVICDVAMPNGLSGIEVCQEIKHHNPATRVVLISAYNNKAVRLEGYDARADDYIDKLMSDEEIFKKVINPYLTQKKKPVTFLPVVAPETQKKVIDDFENQVNKIFTNYYKSPVNNRPKALLLEYFEDKLHKSKRTIQREFQLKTNKSFSEFHTHFKITLASRWLIKSTRSISDIAAQLNFSTPSHFSKCFKQLHGMTPSQYRSNYDK